MRRKILLIVASTRPMLMVLSPAAVEANHSWGGYHWARVTWAS
jgi:hypothetical protein